MAASRKIRQRIYIYQKCVCLCACARVLYMSFWTLYPTHLGEHAPHPFLIHFFLFALFLPFPLSCPAVGTDSNLTGAGLTDVKAVG